MKKPKGISAKIPEVGNFVVRRRLGEHIANKTQIAKVLFLGLQAERAEFRGRLQGAQIDRTDKVLVRTEALEEVMDDSEEFFWQRGEFGPLVGLIPIDDAGQFLLEKI